MSVTTVIDWNSQAEIDRDQGDFELNHGKVDEYMCNPDLLSGSIDAVRDDLLNICSIQLRTKRYEGLLKNFDNLNLIQIKELAKAAYELNKRMQEHIEDLINDGHLEND